MSEFAKVRSEYPPTIPLRELELYLPAPPDGWVNWLAARSIQVIPDDLGRDSIPRQAARRLLDEQRELELKQAALRKVQEQEAVEADERRWAAIWGGVRADHMPPGVAPAAVMLQAAHDSRPKRTSVLEEQLSGAGMVYHPIHQQAEDE
jgi:hypothetical protein